MSKKNLAVGVALLLVAVACRTYRLQEESIWFDEAVSARELTPGIGLDDFLDGVRKLDPTADPLYFASLWAWTSMVGSSEWACRSLSIAFGVLSILFIYLAGLEYLGKRTDAIVVALLACLSVTHIYYSQEVRMYPLYLLLASASIYGLLRFFKRDGRWPLGINLVANMLLVWTHLLSPLLLAAEGVAVLWHCRRTPRTVVTWAVPQMLNVGIWWVCWGRAIQFERIPRAASWILTVEWTAAGFWRDWMANLSHVPVHPLSNLIGAVAMVFALLGLIVIGSRCIIKKNVPAEDLFAILVAGTPAALFLFSKLIYPVWVVRYTVYAPIGLLLLSVLGTRIAPKVHYLLVAVLVLPFLIQFPLLQRPFRPDWKHAVSILNDGRPVVLVPAYERQTVKGLLEGNTVGLTSSLEKTWGCWPKCDQPGADCCVRHEEQVNAQLQQLGGWMAITSTHLVAPARARMEQLGYSSEVFQALHSSFSDISIFMLQPADRRPRRASGVGG